MPASKRKFMQIFRIELEDLMEDISILIDAHRCRKDKGEITEYVYRENVALLANEKSALESFLRELDSFESENCHDLGELESEIERRFDSFLSEHCYSRALESLVRKKLGKVLDYCRSGTLS